MTPESLAEITGEIGGALGAAVVAIDAIAGGDINDAFRVRLADRRTVFVKVPKLDAPAGIFAAEAAGLEWLRGGPLRVPGVLAWSERWLALEWLELAGRPPDALFGRGLAMLHQRGAPSFGLDRDNFLATLRQDNALGDDWPTFYVERRLRPLCERAALHRAIPDVGHKLDQLRGSTQFGPAEPPARLHGDLWWGNVSACQGQPVIYDPAVYGGHREIDLAMLALFGGLPDALIAAYHECYPLADGWRERILLHQLYPIAAHAYLFGGTYVARLVQALDALTASSGIKR